MSHPVSPPAAGRADFWRAFATRPAVVAASLVAGLAAGLLFPASAVEIGVIGEIYVDLLKMIILPFMVSAVIFSLRQLLREGGSTRMLGRVLAGFAGLMLLAVLAGLLASSLVGPGRDLEPDTLITLGKLVGADLTQSGHVEMALRGETAPAASTGVAEMLLNLIPSNIFAALTKGETLKALVFSLLFGLAISQVPAKASDTLAEALETIYQTCLRLTHWFNYLLPLVLFAMVASQTAKTGLAPLRAMAGFLLALGAASALLIALSFAVLHWHSRRPWREVLRSQREPMTMAIATRSSAACMPAMIESLTGRLGFSVARVELLVPLGVSLLRLGPALYYVVATLFIAQLYGRDLQAAEIGLVLIGSLLAGVASSGMSGFVTLSLTGLVCDYIGLPFEAAMALFLAIDPLCDMLRTAVLVAGNNAFAAFVCGRRPAAG